MLLIQRVRSVTCRGALVVAVAALCSTSAHGQAPAAESAEIPRSQESLDAAIQAYPLRAGGMLRHNQYDGWIRRVDEDLKVVVQAKVPKARLIDRSTTVVLAANQSRLLLIHHDDQMHFPAKHKVALLDVATLKTLLELPLGECQDPRGSFPVMTEQLTMVCHHSRPLDQPKRRPTFALVTLNLNRGEVVRWFPLEGERHGAWFGPMFFGYTYDVYSVHIERGRKDCPSAPTLPLLETPEQAVIYPLLVLVLKRSKGDTKGEVWFVSADAAAPPKRVALLQDMPTSALICEAHRKLLYVTEERAAAAAKNGRPTPTERIVEVFDLSSGARIAQQ